jgi:C4-dicarboxylate-specific signal transduction histidine kinase
MNLVTNAAHAIGNHPGVIEITLEPAAVDDEHATPGLRPGHFARLTVADNGCGMERGTIGRIFDPFFSNRTLAMISAPGSTSYFEKRRRRHNLDKIRMSVVR